MVQHGSSSDDLDYGASRVYISQCGNCQISPRSYCPSLVLCSLLIHISIMFFDESKESLASLVASEQRETGPRETDFARYTIDDQQNNRIPPLYPPLVNSACMDFRRCRSSPELSSMIVDGSEQSPMPGSSLASSSFVTHGFMHSSHPADISWPRHNVGDQDSSFSLDADLSELRKSLQTLTAKYATTIHPSDLLRHVRR
ncbi:hypothetical protein AcW1_001586 [Taiwanofungus camphoratus]|nr:hypothetical protein AcW1_001586 [Antrodia cinnamomea]